MLFFHHFLFWKIRKLYCSAINELIVFQLASSNFVMLIIILIIKQKYLTTLLCVCQLIFLFLFIFLCFSGSGEVLCRLGLIDFGCAIDVKLFPPGTRFSVDKNTESFECIEMKTQRPWTTQVCFWEEQNYTENW